MHGSWYTGGMGALGASSGLQGGFSTAGSLGGAVVPHSQPYHLGLSSMVSSREIHNTSSFFGELLGHREKRELGNIIPIKVP